VVSHVSVAIVIEHIPVRFAQRNSTVAIIRACQKDIVLLAN